MNNEETKLVITDEMVTSFAGMIKSNDSGDTRLAVDILNNRDKTNEASEKNFKEISNHIIDNDKLFPTGTRYVITINNKILTLSGGTIFHSVGNAKSSLSRHLTNYLGKSAKKFTLTNRERGTINGKSTKGSHNYDPNFNKLEYIQKLKDSRLEEMGSKGNWGDKKQYFKAIKMVFGDGPSLRDFLLDNGIAKIITI